jgi:acetoacetyl-CoA synthetase
METIQEGTILWQPSQEQIESTELFRYLGWLRETRGIELHGYHDVWQWSVDHLEAFWDSVWDYFDIGPRDKNSPVLQGTEMPNVQWFPGTMVNYAEYLFRNITDVEKPAILFESESGKRISITWGELRERVSSVAYCLRQMGVQPGDHVAAYMPNIPQTVVAFLASASIGAVWTSCSPDFGTTSVVDRFKQVRPKVLFTVDGYMYNGREFDRTSVVEELSQALPTLEQIIVVPYLRDQVTLKVAKSTVLWSEVSSTPHELAFATVPFSHPLWVLYSSGTTGIPKAIVHGHGGIIIEYLKAGKLQNNMGPDDRFFQFTTTGWMMWNYLVATLLTGAAIVLYDGHPAYPSIHRLWEVMERTGTTAFGTSAGYISSCMKAGIEPGKLYDLSKLQLLVSTGSPLSAEGFQWVYNYVKPDIWLTSQSGGTDVATGFVGGSPILPVRIGELQCRLLGVWAEAFDDEGNTVIDEVGELVIRNPMPSMPLYFLNDPDSVRLRESYFEMYPGVWRHGDWIQVKEHGGSIIYGRSDSTINRHGIRMGTGDIYQAVESLDEIMESLVVDLELLGRQSFLPLFVVLRPSVELHDELKSRIRRVIQTNVSPRHVPDEIYQVSDIPKTLSGKKMEVPIRRILLGHPLEKVINQDSMANPTSLSFFIDLATQLNM